MSSLMKILYTVFKETRILYKNIYFYEIYMYILFYYQIYAWKIIKYIFNTRSFKYIRKRKRNIIIYA